MFNGCRVIWVSNTEFNGDPPKTLQLRSTYSYNRLLSWDKTMFRYTENFKIVWAGNTNTGTTVWEDIDCNRCVVESVL